METTANKHIEWANKCSIKCSCGRENIINFCDKPKCSLNNTQQAYCGVCEGEDKHEHSAKKLYLVCSELDKLWSKLKEEATEAADNATRRYKEL